MSNVLTYSNTMNGGGGGSGITSLTGDVTATGPGAAAATIANSAITNAKVAAAAAIDYSKLAALTSGNILVGNGSNVATSVAMSGDATISNAGAVTVTKTHIAINTQTASYTLVLGDDGKLIIMNVGSANNLTVPLNSSVAYATGTQIAVQQLGAGQTTIVATGGVTLQSTPGLKISARYGVVTLIKVGTDTWVVSGALSA